MKTRDSRLTRMLASLASAIAACALLLPAPAAQATPVTYNFSTGIGFTNPGDSVALNALSALGFSATVSGSFMYDAASPATGTGTGGVTIYGNAAGTSPSFFGLSGSAGGFSFSDPRGFVTVGNNTQPFGFPITLVDQIQYYADSALTSGPHNFAGFNIGGSNVVNLRMFWSTGLPGIPADFITNQSLPGTPPGMQGRLALDLGVSGDPNVLSQHWIFFDNLSVSAAEVSEPRPLLLVLAGLGLIAFSLRRKGKAGAARPGTQTVKLPAQE